MQQQLHNQYVHVHVFSYAGSPSGNSSNILHSWTVDVIIVLIMEASLSEPLVSELKSLCLLSLVAMYQKFFMINFWSLSRSVLHSTSYMYMCVSYHSLLLPVLSLTNNLSCMILFGCVWIVMHDYCFGTILSQKVLHIVYDCMWNHPIPNHLHKGLRFDAISNSKSW